MPIEKGKKITEYITKIGRVAQTSHYQVNFSGLKSDLMTYLNNKGVDKDFITREVGLRCSSASLPGNSLATLNIDGNYMGVQEKMAHSRIYTQIDLEFYVDRDYKMIRFFDCWMDYIAGGKSSIDKKKDNYYYRMTYPRGDSGYKCDTIDIYKFERDQGSELQYTFYGMFPVNLSSLPVQYGNSDTLKMNVTFNYERYIKGDIKKEAPNSRASDPNSAVLDGLSEQGFATVYDSFGSSVTFYDGNDGQLDF